MCTLFLGQADLAIRIMIPTVIRYGIRNLEFAIPIIKKCWVRVIVIFFIAKMVALGLMAKQTLVTRFVVDVPMISCIHASHRWLTCVNIAGDDFVWRYG